eukprot:4788960-Amphidinium_carterae.1
MLAACAKNQKHGPRCGRGHCKGMMTCCAIMSAAYRAFFEIRIRNWFEGTAHGVLHIMQRLQANLTFMQQIIAGDSWGQLNVPIIEELLHMRKPHLKSCLLTRKLCHGNC